MTRERMDGLYLMLLGSLVFLLLGTFMERSAKVTTIDFKVVYYSARCLLHSSDPYQPANLAATYHSQGGESPWDTPKFRQIETTYMYLPTAFIVTVPFALLPFGPAHVLWLAITAGTLLLASFLMGNLGASHAPVASGGLICLLLINSVVLLLLGNPAGIAISLCVIAVWCFLKDRFAVAGVLCLALSLALKPHDAGLVWLYFLLAGGVFLKRALQTLAVTLALCLPPVLWVTHIAPGWIRELSSNLALLATRGGLNDPGLTTAGARGVGMMVNLQTVVSMVWTDPRVYNPLCYLVGGGLLFLWAFAVRRSRPSSANAQLALAAVACLSMLPVYHRQHDLKLLLLTIPACAMLWAQRGISGRLALLVNTAGLVLAGDLLWIVFDRLIPRMTHAGLPGWGLTALWALPVPLILLIMGVFYLLSLARPVIAPGLSAGFERQMKVPPGLAAR